MRRPRSSGCLEELETSNLEQISPQRSLESSHFNGSAVSDSLPRGLSSCSSESTLLGEDDDMANVPGEPPFLGGPLTPMRSRSLSEAKTVKRRGVAPRKRFRGLSVVTRASSAQSVPSAVSSVTNPTPTSQHQKESPVSDFSNERPRSVVSDDGEWTGVYARLVSSGDVGGGRGHSELRYSFGVPAGRQKLGLTIESSRGRRGPRIMKLKETSPLRGLADVGDRIVQVEDIDTTTMNATQVSKVLSRFSNNRSGSFRITVSRRANDKHSVPPLPGWGL